MTVIDLHCDLLSYLALANGGIDHPEVRCSRPQLKAGGVKLQVMAIYTPTDPDSPMAFDRQVDVYQQLIADPISQIRPLKPIDTLKLSDSIVSCVSIENASGLIDEQQPITKALARLDDCERRCGKIAYVSLTWKTENRFGGGNETTIGLKPDGEVLIDYLVHKAIPIDLSHTSDQLAYDILNYLQKKGHQARLLASHSNFRAVTDHPRNLPMEWVQEIVASKGLIGLNFVAPFLGAEPLTALINHVEYAVQHNLLGSLALGADFFFDQAIGTFYNPKQTFFVAPLCDASCYPTVNQALSTILTWDQLDWLFYKNAQNFLSSVFFQS